MTNLIPQRFQGGTKVVAPGITMNDTDGFKGNQQILILPRLCLVTTHGWWNSLRTHARRNSYDYVCDSRTGVWSVV